MLQLFIHVNYVSLLFRYDRCTCTCVKAFKKRVKYRIFGLKKMIGDWHVLFSSNSICKIWQIITLIYKISHISLSKLNRSILTYHAINIKRKIVSSLIWREYSNKSRKRVVMLHFVNLVAVYRENRILTLKIGIGRINTCCVKQIKQRIINSKIGDWHVLFGLLS